MSETIDESRRREAFLALVNMQDQGGTVYATREQIAATFGISVSSVQGIEHEGIRKQWPPLGDATAPQNSTATDFAATDHAEAVPSE